MHFKRFLSQKVIRMHFRRFLSQKVTCKLKTPPGELPCIPKPCLRYCEPVAPTYIKICKTKRECEMKQLGETPYVPPKPYYVHGKLLWGVKSAILLSTVAFTIQQGVWGNQNETVECATRWSEYIRSLTMRKPPTFDKCGKVQVILPPDIYGGLIGPIWEFYKDIVTTCFNGVVKMPHIIKCAYINYQKEMEKMQLQREANDRLMRKNK